MAGMVMGVGLWVVAVVAVLATLAELWHCWTGDVTGELW